MEEKKQIRKLVLIVCGVTAAVLFICLAIRIGTNRLPEEPGVAVYYTWLDDAEGRNYMPLSAGGKARSGAGRQKIWRSFEEYEQEAEQYWHEPQKPLSVWTWSEKIPGIDSFLVGEQGSPFFFSVKESGGAKVRSVAVRRWPLELAGTDAVKADSWTGREDVTFNWKEGWLGGLSKGSFQVEAGYLYSIIVSWDRGWDEFSFAVNRAWQE